MVNADGRLRWREWGMVPSKILVGGDGDAYVPQNINFGSIKMI